MSAIITQPVRITLIVSFSIVLISCRVPSPFPEGKRVCESAVDRFHGQYNRKEFHEIWEQADEDFRGSYGEVGSLSRFLDMHRRLGPNMSRPRLINMYVNYNGQKTIATLIYDTYFRNGRARETFLYDVSGQNVILHRYTAATRWGRFY